MFHTLLDSLRADCRRFAGRARWPAPPGPRIWRRGEHNGEDFRNFPSASDQNGAVMRSKSKESSVVIGAVPVIDQTEQIPDNSLPRAACSSVSASSLI